VRSQTFPVPNIVKEGESHANPPFPTEDTMQREVRLFVIPKDRVPAGPPQACEPFSVEAPTMDGLFNAAKAEIADRGFRLRSVSYGPKGLVAYAEETK
jgi:lysozyme family protein